MYYTNSEGESISIEYASVPPFEGKPLLVMHDDPLYKGGTGIRAPMLIDEGLRDWLLETLPKLNV